MNEQEDDQSQNLPTFNDLINGEINLNQTDTNAKAEVDVEAKAKVKIEPKQEIENKVKLEPEVKEEVKTNPIPEIENKAKPEPEVKEEIETNPIPVPIPKLIQKQNNTKVLTEDEKERRIIEEITSLLSEVSTLKEEGNFEFKSGNFSQAENIYSKAIEKVHTYAPSQTITKEVPEIITLLQEMQKLFIILLGNLSMSLSKQLKYKQAIEKASMVIDLDPNNEKSYLRLLQWFIANGEIEKANYIAKDIKSKFQLAQFKENLDILEGINTRFDMEEFNNNKKTLKKEKSNSKSMPWIAGGLFVIASGLLATLLIKAHKMKNIVIKQ